MNVQDIITEHLDIWTTAQQQQKSGGRGRGKKKNDQSLYGIKKMRELILDLAVRGKLVEQNPADEPASALLDRIAVEKVRLIKEKKIKKQKKLPEITEEEKPFDLPEGWEWSRLGCIATFENGDRSKRYPNKSDWQSSGIPFFGAKDMVDGVLSFDNGLRFISQEKFDLLSNGKLTDKDFVMLLRGTVGKMAIFHTTGDFLTGFINAQMIIIRMLKIDLCYFFDLYRESSFFQSLVTDKTTGTAVRQMPANVLLNFLVPLPPLPEQHRIVAKVDELMALCDQLEQQQTTSNATHQTLLQTLLATLIKSADHETSTAAWERIATHFDVLFTTEQSIDQLQQTILQLAVMGKLVPQNPEDEPASQLLEKIAKEKARLLKESKIKKQKKLPEITEEEKPFALPEGWVWAKFPELGEFGRGKSKHRPRNDPSLYINGKYQLVQTGDVARATGIVKTYTALYNEKGLSQSKLWPKGTMCITIAANIADSSLLGFEACFPDSVVGFIPSSGLGNVNYFEFFIRTAKKQLMKFAPSTAQKNINLGILGKVNIPLPPLLEQHRIVAKVDELMALCDQLKTNLHENQITKLQLADTIVNLNGDHS